MNLNQAPYSAITDNIEVKVTPLYVPEKSRPEEGMFLYKYRIIILNKGSKEVQLLSRCWKIRNGNKKEEVVRGPGVVGKTPILGPGQSFSYESFCPLNTATGNMRGHLEFLDLENDQKFDVNVPLFFFRLDH